MNIPLDPQAHIEQELENTQDHIQHLLELGYTEEKLKEIRSIDQLILNGLFKEL
jgi:hypothetical protein